MKVSEKLSIIRRISEEIEKRYNWSEATNFIKAFYNEAHTYHHDFESIAEMTSSNFSLVDTSVLGEVIDDLGIEAIAHITNEVQTPKIWEENTKFRIFISHLAKNKGHATRLRDTLEKYHISAFVAHEDIEPTLEWQVQIERALHSMNAYVSIHTEGYGVSPWCQQETGFAFGKGIKIIALRMDEDPSGFISKHQAISRGTKKAENVAEEIDKLLKADDRTQGPYEKCQPKSSGYDSLDDDIPF